MTLISASLRQDIQQRAQDRCEYCHLLASLSFFPHEVDHIIALKHGGSTTVDNLAFACFRCNRHKGSDLGSFDPETGLFSFLFHPRTQDWSDHFHLHNHQIVGKTPAGRTTVQLLKFNTPERQKERQLITLQQRNILDR